MLNNKHTTFKSFTDKTVKTILNYPIFHPIALNTNFQALM